MQDILKVFFGESPELLADVETACQQVKFQTGATILGEEDAGASVYYVLAGRVKTVRYSSDGAEVWIDETGAGALFGEMTALGASARTATVVAATNVTVAVFTQGAFLELMEKHGSIGLAVSRLLVQRVEKTTQRLFELAAFSSKGRVYSELLRQATPIAGSPHSEIAKMPSMSAMARQLNNTRETVSRTVNELEKEGFIERSGSKLTILMPDELRDMASG
jgi:CRP/FNR family cyclic AMP-dependent transcriptional regulator